MSKGCVYLPHGAKALLELFCLQSIVFGWRQSSSSSVFASWGKMKIHDFTLADQDWIGVMNFNSYSDQNWIGFNFIGSGLDSDWKISQSAHLWSEMRIQQTAEMSTDQDWIRTEANFDRIKTGSNCNFFEIWQIRTGSDWENFCCFNEIILKISKILSVIRFHRFAKWQCIFCHQKQKLSWGYFAIRIVPIFILR